MGASAVEPENTLRSIRRALEFGADFVEVNVRATANGRLVVIHDSTVDRTTNVKGAVSSLTFEELRRLDAGFGEKIPTLDEAVKRVRGKAKLVVEIKVREIEENVVQLLKENRFVNQVIVTSFNHSVVKHMKELCPNIKTGVIFSSRPVKPVNLALDAQSDSLFPRFSYVDKELVQECHENGLEVFPWPVDIIEDMKCMVTLGVDGIVTNKPDLANSVLRQE